MTRIPVARSGGAPAAARRWAAGLTGAALALMAVLTVRGPVSAQDAPGPGSIVGRVHAADDGQPIRFSLVYLVPADSARVRARVTLTDSAGAFWFRDVPAGVYRLRVDRLGYEPEPGPPVRLAAGEPYTAELSSAPRPVRIAPIVVSGEACYGAAELKEVPELAALWREAAKAAEARRQFDLSYRYLVTVRQLVWRPSMFGSVRSASERVQTMAPALAAMLEEHGSDWGFVASVPGGLRITAPELPELFGPTFLRTHCLVAEPGWGTERRIGFRPSEEDATRVLLRGSVVLDAGFGVSRLEFEYVQGGIRIARGALRYGDVPVLGSRLRFARQLDLDGTPGLGGRRWSARVRIDDYRSFTRDSTGENP